VEENSLCSFLVHNYDYKKWSSLSRSLKNPFSNCPGISYPRQFCVEQLIANINIAFVQDRQRVPLECIFRCFELNCHFGAISLNTIQGRSIQRPFFGVCNLVARHNSLVWEYRLTGYISIYFLASLFLWTVEIQKFVDLAFITLHPRAGASESDCHLVLGKIYRQVIRE
jgi:hypothetical protein